MPSMSFELEASSSQIEEGGSLAVPVAVSCVVVKVEATLPELVLLWVGEMRPLDSGLSGLWGGWSKGSSETLLGSVLDEGRRAAEGRD